jgi:hypothetical protein
MLPYTISTWLVQTLTCHFIFRQESITEKLNQKLILELSTKISTSSSEKGGLRSESSQTHIDNHVSAPSSKSSIRDQIAAAMDNVKRQVQMTGAPAQVKLRRITSRI